MSYEAALPEFERTSGIKVTTGNGPSQGPGENTIPNQLRRGVAADVVLMSREGLDELIHENRIIKGSDVNLAQTRQIGSCARFGSMI